MRDTSSRPDWLEHLEALAGALVSGGPLPERVGRAVDPLEEAVLRLEDQAAVRRGRPTFTLIEGGDDAS